MATDADTRALALYREQHHVGQPTYARELKRQAFELSPLLKTMV